VVGVSAARRLLDDLSILGPEQLHDAAHGDEEHAELNQPQPELDITRTNPVVSQDTEDEGYAQHQEDHFRKSAHQKVSEPLPHTTVVYMSEIYFYNNTLLYINQAQGLIFT
jgi:hypothetical protein